MALTHPETMDTLWKLVDLDAQLVRNAQDEAKARGDLAKVEAKVAAAHKTHIAAQAALNKARADQKSAEQDMKQHEDRIKRLESGEIKHSGEALEKERKVVDDLETRGLELLEGIQRSEADELKARHLQDAARSELAAAQSVTDSLLKNLKAVADSLRQLRAATAAPVAPAVMDSYESANRGNPGSALCRIKDRQCIGCGDELTLQHIVQVKGRNEIMRCPSCARIQDAPLISAA
ncbi:MAG: hypothetical protein IT462_11145 [Planctomycetes bacterium]|nr:hypothetical protein [Planctomycetota bacterium]